jgi:rhomboid protease GluP
VSALPIFLLVVAALAGWQAQLILRRGGPRRRTFGWMLLACAIAALVAWAGSHDEGAAPSAGIVGFVAILAFVFLVIVPGFLRSLARWAVARDRVPWALRLLSWREHLQPGMGALDEREALAAYAELRDGRPSRVMESLLAARAAAQDPGERRAIDERIVVALLSARSFADAADHYQRHLEATPGPISAHVLVEMVRAYGELGALARAAALMARIEESSLPDEPMLRPVIARARMVFLAFAGRVESVAAMLAPAGPLGAMPPSARAFWLGIARRQAGDLVGAKDALTAAVASARGDRRASRIAQEELDGLGRRGGAATARTLGPDGEASTAGTASPPGPPSAEVIAIIDRVAERALTAGTAAAPGAHAGSVPDLEGVSVRRVPVTATLIAANLIVAAVVAARLGSTFDPTVLADAGANLRVATRAGEWWRLVSSTFLHIGAIHLVVNMWSLWVLGRVVEQLFGPRRFFVLYLAAGVGGAWASVIVGGGTGVSAGASGAIFGLLGAAIAEFALRRKAYPDRWRRQVLANLVFLAIANLIIGEAVKVIDQAAHVGGLVSGLVVGATLAPRGRLGRTAFARRLSAALALGALAVVAVSLVLVATTAPSTTLARVGWETVVQPLAVEGKAGAGAGAASEGASVELDMPRLLGGYGFDPLLAQTNQPEDVLVKALLDELPPARLEVVPARFDLPGWTSHERLLSAGGGRFDLRIAVFTQPVGEGTRALLVAIPERHVEVYAPQLRRIADSIRLVGLERSR